MQTGDSPSETGAVRSPRLPDVAPEDGKPADHAPPTATDPFTTPELVVAPPAAQESYSMTPGAPDDAVEQANRQRILGQWPPIVEPQEAEERRQFTTRDVLLLTIAAAVVLGILKATLEAITPRELALVSGGLAMLGIPLFVFFRPWFLVRAVWWTLVALYVASLGVAIWQAM